MKADGVVDLADGRKCPVMVGDWLIANGGVILTVVGAGDLDRSYDILQEGALTLPAEACRQLRDRLGPGATTSSQALVAAVDRLGRILVQGVEVSFTPGQLEELAFRAGKRGHTVQQEIEDCVRRLRDELFWKA